MSSVQPDKSIVRTFFTPKLCVSVAAAVTVVALAALAALTIPVGTVGFYLAIDAGALDILLLSVLFIQHVRHYNKSGKLVLPTQTPPSSPVLPRVASTTPAPSQPSQTLLGSPVLPHVASADPRDIHETPTQPSQTPPGSPVLPHTTSTDPSDIQVSEDDEGSDSDETYVSPFNVTQVEDTPNGIPQRQVELPSQPETSLNRPLPVNAQSIPTPQPSLGALGDHQIRPLPSPTVIKSPKPSTSKSHTSGSFLQRVGGVLQTGIEALGDLVSAPAEIYNLATQEGTINEKLASLYDKREELGGGRIQQRAHSLLLENVVDSVLGQIATVDLKNLGMMTIAEKINHLQLAVDKFGPKKGAGDVTEQTMKQNAALNEFKEVIKVLYELENPETNFAKLRLKFFDALTNAYNSDYYKNNIDQYLKDAKTHDFREIHPSFNESGNESYLFIYQMQKLGFALFNNMELHTFADQSVFSIIDRGLNGKTLAETVESDRHGIESAPGELKGSDRFAKFHKILGHFNLLFAPNEVNNYASKLWTEKIKKGDREFETHCLRFGTPTKEGNNNPKIVEHMRLFLDYCVVNRLTLLSFQNQNPSEKNVLKGNEKARLDAIFALAKEERYQDAFIAIGIPLDGDFYNQANTPQEMNAAEFKDGLHKHITNNDHYYFNWDQIVKRAKEKNDPSITQQDIENEINLLLNQVHQHFFPDKEILTEEERLNFLFLTNVYLENYFVALLEPEYYHTQCKDAMDRAGSLFSSTFYLHMIRLRKELDPEAIDDFRTTVHTAPLIIKGTAIHGKRFERMKGGLEILEGLSDEQKEAIRAPMQVFGVPTSVKGVSITKKSNQTVFKLPAEAFSVEEYSALMDHWVQHPIPTDHIDGYRLYHSKSSPNMGMDLFSKDLKRSFHYRFNGKDLPDDTFYDVLTRTNQIVSVYKKKSSHEDVQQLHDPDTQAIYELAMKHSCETSIVRPAQFFEQAQSIDLKQDDIDLIMSIYRKYPTRHEFDENLMLALIEKASNKHKNLSAIIKILYENNTSSATEKLTKMLGKVTARKVITAYHTYGYIREVYEIAITAQIKKVSPTMLKEGDNSDLLYHFLNQSTPGDIFQACRTKFDKIDFGLTPIQYRENNQNNVIFDVIDNNKRRGIQVTTLFQLRMDEIVYYIKGKMWIDLNSDKATITTELSQKPPRILEGIDRHSVIENYDPNQPSTSGTSRD